MTPPSPRCVRLLGAALALLAPTAARAQSPARPPAPLRSTVIRADSARSVRATAVGSQRSVLDTVTATLGHLEAHVTTLAPGKESHAPHRHPDEEVIVVLRGTLETTQEGVVRRAPAGSLIFQASNELHGLRNAGRDTAAYYVIRPAPRDLPPALVPAEESARAFLNALDPSARSAAAFPFDSPVRTTWNFVPMERQGLQFGSMTPAQRGNVDALLHSALSDGGFATAQRIIAHESILRALEQEAGVRSFAQRDPARYIAAVFGTPSADSVWGWRVEGHHLSVNVTRVDGEPQVVTPLFMGANPARVPSGPNAGLRILAAEEDEGRALVRMLPAARRTRAVISDSAYGEIVTRNDPKARPLALEGLAAADMSPQEQAQLRRLLGVYLARMAPEVARDQLARIERAGFGRLHFAWAGELEPGRPHYYRIHGPTVLVEYDDVQSNANHVHTVWRDLERDFGGDLLREHYAKHKHPHS
jgi:quercetin dioxygenase-like cupin family protein